MVAIALSYPAHWRLVAVAADLKRRGLRLHWDTRQQCLVALPRKGYMASRKRERAA